MIKRNNKKGFTIVELVIVIAVIAILAAVLIPTFAGIIKKANLSADMQAVRQMNVALAADGAVTPTDIFALHEVLAENGMTSEDYRPLTNDTYFFWDADLNRVLHVDKDMIVIAPEEYAGQAYSTTSKWYSLSLEIMEEKIDIKDGKATVANGAQMQYVLNEIKDGKREVAITVNGTIDMMGATFALPSFTKDAGYNITISGGTIKNATAVDYAKEATSSKDGEDGVYFCALIPSVDPGNDVTISDVVIENMSVKNTHASNVALLIGSIQGEGAEATIKNVTIKNSTVIGHRNTGALVGIVGGSGVLNVEGNITLNNVDVKTVGGRSGLLVGINNGGTINATGATITIDKDCSYSIYECEQNTGSATVYNEETKADEKITLGLKDDGTIYSYALANNGSGKYVNQLEKKIFVEKSLVMTSKTEAQAETTEFYSATVNGWN